MEATSTPKPLPRAGARPDLVAELRSLVTALDAGVAPAIATPPPPVANRAARRSIATRGRVARIASAVGMAGVTAVTARAASASFVGGKTVTQGSTAAGDLKLTGKANEDTSQLFTADATNIYPGHAQERLLTLTVAGSIDLKTLSLTTTAGCGTCLSSALDTDTTNGLYFAVERCDIPWSYASGSGNDRVYGCNGTQSTVLAAHAIIGTNSIATNSSLTAGSVNYYRFTYKLSGSSASSMQNKTSKIQLTFTGTQRDGTTR